MPLIEGPSLGGNARHVLRQYAEENALARERTTNAAGNEEFGGGCLRGRYNNLRETVQPTPSIVVVPSLINAGGLFVQRPVCRTNYLVNNAMLGATGSVLPSGWSISTLPAGLTASYSASGQTTAADGTVVDYIDFTLSGTAAASGFLNLRPNASTSTIVATSGQTWNSSVFLALVSGSLANATPTWQLQETTSGGSFNQGSNVTGLASLVSGGALERYNVSRTLTDATTERVQVRWGHSITSGTTYSYTIRIGSPQLERLGRVTPMIRTGVSVTGAVTVLNESSNVVGLPPDFTVTRATTATRVNSSGLIESVASGVPRIDWLGQSCPALLVEASGQNLAWHSETWTSGSNWNLSEGGTPRVTRATGSTSAFTAPDGTTTANAMSPTSGNVAHSMIGNSSTTITYVSGTIYTQSAFFKAGAGNAGRYVQMTYSSTRFSQAGFANFDTQDGVVTLVTGTTADANRNARIENYGNGWYRCSFTATCNGNGTDVGMIPLLITASGSTRAQAFAGTVTDVLYAWGAQLEASSIATTYIPTTTGSASRNADQIVASGALVSGLIGATEGTIYAEVDIRNMAKETWILQIDDGSNTNRIVIRSLTTNLMRGSINATTTAGTVAISSAAFTSGIVKIAFAYKSGDLAVSVNGATALTANGTFTFGSSLNRVLLGGGDTPLNDRIRAAALYTTRLSNEQLSALTKL